MVVVKTSTKNYLKKIVAWIAVLVVSIAGIVFYTTSVSAADDASSSVSVCDDANMPEQVREANGCSSNKSDHLPGLIQGILNSIIGVAGLVAVVYAVIGGIKYMTSAGDVQKLEQAKKTILYSMIGLAICALSFAIVNWTVSIINSNRNNSQNNQLDTNENNEETKKSNSSEQVAQQPSSQNTTKSTDSEQNSKKDQSDSSKNNKSGAAASKTAPEKTASTSEVSNTINATITQLAWPFGTESSKLKKATNAYKKAVAATGITNGVEQESYDEETKSCRRQGMSCGMFVGTVYRYSGVDSKMPNLANKIYQYVKSSSKYQLVEKDYKAGDIVLFVKEKKDVASHVEIVTTINGKLYTAKASVCKTFGHVYKKGVPTRKNGTIKIYRYKT